MRKTDIIHGIDEIANALKESKISRRIHMLGNVQEGDFDVLDGFMHSIYEFSTTAEKFSPAAAKLMGILGLETLVDKSNWTSIFLSEEKRLDFSLQASQNIRFAESFLPRITELLEQDRSDLINPTRNEILPNPNGWASITLTLPEEKNKFSKPERVIYVFESIQHLYGAAAFIYNESPEDLALLACDSGEDKSFEFLGKSRPISLVKEIILTMWDKIIFYRGFEVERRIKLVSKALPIFDKIADMEERKIISREQAALLLVNLEKGVEKIATAGVMIPEIENRTHYDPRKLLTPPKKMVTGELSANMLPEPQKPVKVDVEKLALENTQNAFDSGIRPGESGFIQSLMNTKINKPKTESVENSGLSY